MNIDLHIEELILEGFDPAQRDQIARAVERELGRLFAERGLPPGLARGGVIPRVDGGSYQVRPGASVEASAAQIAGAIYGGMDK